MKFTWKKAALAILSGSRLWLHVKVRQLKDVDAVLCGVRLTQGRMVEATLEDNIVFIMTVSSTWRFAAARTAVRRAVSAQDLEERISCLE